MTTYHLTINIGEKSLRILAAGKYSLCFASAVGDAITNENYDVVALTVPSEALAPTNRLTWSTKYDMAATTQQFQAGSGMIISFNFAIAVTRKVLSLSLLVVAQGLSAKLPIVNGQAYKLSTWSEPASVITSSLAPSNGFALENKVFASALIYLSIPEAGPDPVPIYISPIEVPGVAQFTPINKIAIWFQQNIKTSTMIVVDKSYVHIMDLTHATEQTTTYTDEGTWVDGNGNGKASKAIDYTKVVPAYTGERKKKPVGGAEEY